MGAFIDGQMGQSLPMHERKTVVRAMRCPFANPPTPQEDAPKFWRADFGATFSLGNEANDAPNCRRVEFLPPLSPRETSTLAPYGRNESFGSRFCLWFTPFVRTCLLRQLMGSCISPRDKTSWSGPLLMGASSHNASILLHFGISSHRPLAPLEAGGHRICRIAG